MSATEELDVVVYPNVDEIFRLIPLDGWRKVGLQAQAVNLKYSTPIEIPEWDGTFRKIHTLRDRLSYLNILRVIDGVSVPGFPVICVRLYFNLNRSHSRRILLSANHPIMQCRVLSNLDRVSYLVHRPTMMQFLPKRECIKA